MTFVDNQTSVRAVLFDLDGTLIEFKFKVIEAKKAMILWLEKSGFETTQLSEKMRSQDIFDIAQSQWVSSAQLKQNLSFEHVKESLFRVLEEFEFKGFREARSNPGSFELLKSLKRRNIITAVVTNSGRGPVDYVLDRFDFISYLDLVITRDEMKRLKPNPDGILQAIELLKVSRSECLYVGDSIIDIEAARKAGVTSVGISAGMYDEDLLKETHPDFMIREIEELMKIVLRQHI